MHLLHSGKTGFTAGTASPVKIGVPSEHSKVGVWKGVSDWLPHALHERLDMQVAPRSLSTLAARFVTIDPREKRLLRFQKVLSSLQEKVAWQSAIRKVLKEEWQTSVWPRGRTDLRPHDKTARKGWNELRAREDGMVADEELMNFWV